MSTVRIVPFLLSAVTILAAIFAAVWFLAAQPSANGQTERPIPPAPIQKCMNLSNAMEAPEEGLWGYTIRQQDLVTIKSAGFDTVRMPVKWRTVERTGEPYRLDPDKLARADQIIMDALALDLKIIINMHHYNALNEDPGAHEPRLIAIWTQLAEHYADWPEDLIFEIINEPNSKMTLSRVDRINRRILEIIRETNPERWVIYGTGQWGTLDGMLKSKPPYDPRAMITFHYYSPFEFTHQGASFLEEPRPTGATWGTAAERAEIASEFANAARFRDKTGMPLLLGEFGVYADVPLSQRTDWTAFTRQQAEANGFGWCHWGFASAFRTYDQDSDAWISPLREALIPSSPPLQ